jgi:hypothetical protein
MRVRSGQVLPIPWSLCLVVVIQGDVFSSPCARRISHSAHYCTGWLNRRTGSGHSLSEARTEILRALRTRQHQWNQLMASSSLCVTGVDVGTIIHQSLHQVEVLRPYCVVQWSVAQITHEFSTIEVLAVIIVFPVIVVRVHLWQESDVSNPDRCGNGKRNFARQLRLLP